MNQEIEITLLHGPIGASPKQRATLVGLGLNHRHQVVLRPDTASVRGMIQKVFHLVGIRRPEGRAANAVRGADYEVFPSTEPAEEKPKKVKRETGKKVASAPEPAKPTVQKQAKAKTAANPARKKEA